MRKWFISIIAVILLTGCGAQVDKPGAAQVQGLLPNALINGQLPTIEGDTVVENLQSHPKKGAAQFWEEQKNTVYTVKTTQLYIEPSETTPIAATIGPGDALNQIAVLDEWVRISYYGKEYYTKKEYITLEKPKNGFAVSHEETIHMLTPEQIAEIQMLNASVKGYGSGQKRDPNNRPITPISLQDYYRSKNYNMTWIGDNSEYVFLTFDMGWEYSNDGVRNTEKLLDILKEKNVKAVFFVTHEYVVQQNEDLIRRMIDEGHIIGNHGYSHPDEGIPSLPLEQQLEDTMNMQNFIKDTFNYDMYMYRFSSSYYSEMSLDMVNKMGYHTLFWSMESVDWYVANQPDPNQLLQEYMQELHPGAIYMMHAVSNSNIEIMGQFIDQVRSQGYEFGYYHR